MTALTHQINDEQIEKVLRQANVLSDEEQFTSSRIVNGFCNPIYHIRVSNGQEYVLKVTNPHWKKLKTRNEAIVLDFLYQYTNIPVPKVISYSSIDDLIGYEYILMTYISGIPFSEIYDSLSFEERKPYLSQLAKIYVDMVNLDITSIDRNKLGCFEQIVENNGTFEARLCPNVDSQLGPYDNIYNYSCDYIQFRLADMSKGKYARYVSKFQAIINLLQEKQNSESIFDERVVLTHTDIAPKNIIIDPKTKTIRALIDWEWCSLMVTDQDFETMTTGDVWNGEQATNFLREQMGALLGKERMKLYQEQFDNRKNMNDAVSEAMVIVSYPDWYHGREHLIDEAEKNLEREVETLFERFGV